MDTPRTIAILNELLAAEQDALLPHLLRSALVVSPTSAAELDTLRRIERETQEHSAWLAELILERDGAPALRPADTRVAGMHYRDLHHALPLLLNDCTARIDLYQRAAEQLGSDRDALALVDRIRTRHEQHRQTLQSPVSPSSAPAL